MDSSFYGAAAHPTRCTKLFPGTVSERPKVQLSKSCVGVEPTVGSNPTGSANFVITTAFNDPLDPDSMVLDHMNSASFVGKPPQS
jgi:hypothetical protein